MSSYESGHHIIWGQRHVAEVSVRENDVVSPGQLLFRLDRSRFRIALGQARAALHSARQEVATLRALYRQKTAELSSAREEILYYDGEYERFEKLEKQGHISRTQFEEARRDRMRSGGEGCAGYRKGGGNGNGNQGLRKYCGH